VSWTSPSLSDLQGRLSRDLRDTDGVVFTPDMLMDYANEALVELSRAKPIEAWGDILALPADFDPTPVDIWALAKIDLATNNVDYLPPMDDNVATEGWLFYGGQILLGPRLQATLPDMVAPQDGSVATTALRWFGYRVRDVFDGDPDDTADFIDAEDEIAVRRYVRWAGLRALDGDRGLYQQWQQQANNSDVSPTQLTQMVGMAQNDWETLRRKIITFRHPPLGTR
jgi:hypothetical protein